MALPIVNKAPVNSVNDAPANFNAPPKNLTAPPLANITSEPSPPSPMP